MRLAETVLLLTTAVAISLCGCVSKKKDGTADRSTPISHSEDPPDRREPDRRDPATACRDLAPEDPYASSEGGEEAYQACREAARISPSDADTLYRLGTASLQTDRKDEAFSTFQKAEQLGSCKALYFLGDAAWYGDHDAARAEEYYTRGANCGDRRAAHEIYQASTFEASGYPAYIAALYRGDIEQLNKVRFFSASYVEGFYETLGEQYLGASFDPCWTTKYYGGGEILYRLRAAEKGDASNFIESAIYQKALPTVFPLLFPEQAQQGLDEIRDTARKAGHADLIRMVEASKCGALMPYKILNGVKAFANARKSLYDVAREVAPNIHSLDDLLSAPWKNGR